MIYLMRHGKAVSLSDFGDQGRWLTSEGREDVRNVASLLAKKNVKIDSVVSSPLVRAVQSAEIMASTLKYPGTLKICGDVVPEGDVEMAKLMIQKRGPNVLVLSHESFVSRFVEDLTGKENYFATAELRCLDAKSVKWVLKP